MPSCSSGVRRPDQAVRSGGQGGSRALRRARCACNVVLEHGATVGSALVRATDHHVRRKLLRRDRLPGTGKGGKRWHATAGWVEGLGALIPTGESRRFGIDGTAGDPRRAGRPGQDQPNQPGSASEAYFDEEALVSKLTASVRAAGRTLQPILVRPLDDGDRFELIAGDASVAGSQAGRPAVRACPHRGRPGRQPPSNRRWSRTCTARDLNALEIEGAPPTSNSDGGLPAPDPRSRWPTGWARAARPSPTPSDCSNSHPRCRSWWPSASALGRSCAAPCSGSPDRLVPGDPGAKAGSHRGPLGAGGRGGGIVRAKLGGWRGPEPRARSLKRPSPEARPAARSCRPAGLLFELEEPAVGPSGHARQRDDGLEAGQGAHRVRRPRRPRAHLPCHRRGPPGTWRSRM